MNIVELEISRALQAAGCGILRWPTPVEAPTMPKLLSPPPPPLPPVNFDGELRGRPPMPLILAYVARETGISGADIIGEWRRVPVVLARFIFYRIALMTGRTTPQIGRFCGDRDHSTVLHGIDMVEKHTAKYEPEYSRLKAIFQKGEAE